MISTCGAGITAAAGTGLAHHLFIKFTTLNKSLQSKHRELPYHTFVHCRGFAPAASLRTRTLISVSFWRSLLSQPLPIIDLVSHYLTNNLIGCHLILLNISTFQFKIYISFTLSFPSLLKKVRQIIDMLLSIPQLLLTYFHGLIQLP